MPCAEIWGPCCLGERSFTPPTSRGRTLGGGATVACGRCLRNPALSRLTIHSRRLSQHRFQFELPLLRAAAVPRAGAAVAAVRAEARAAVARVEEATALGGGGDGGGGEGGGGERLRLTGSGAGGSSSRSSSGSSRSSGGAGGNSSNGRMMNSGSSRRPHVVRASIATGGRR